MNELDRLKAMLDAQQVRLGVHIRRMNSPGSPVYNSWENIWPAALILGLSFVALKYGGAPFAAIGLEQANSWAGLVVLVVGCWWWITKVMPKVKDGVFDRSAGYALQSAAHFDALWAKGVLSLYAKLADGTERAATKRDDWRNFVRLLDAEFNGPPPDDEAPPPDGAT